MGFALQSVFTSRVSTGESPLNIVVVFEDPSTKQRRESKPYAFASTLDVRCLCGNLIHPIVGVCCPQCRAKVVEVRREYGKA